MKRALAVIVAVTLVSAGCGRDDDSAGDETESEQPADGDTSDGTDSDEPVEGSVSVWAMGTEDENLGVIAENFMAEYPDVSVDVTPVPWDAAHDRIVSAIADGAIELQFALPMPAVSLIELEPTQR